MQRTLSRGPHAAALRGPAIARRAPRFFLTVACLVAGCALPQDAWGVATFAPLAGNLTVRVGEKSQLSAPAALGSASLTDNDLIGSIDLATAGLTVTRISDQLTFSATGTSITNAAAPAGNFNAISTLLFVQTITTTTPQWMELSAKVTSPPLDPGVYSLLTVMRSGQQAPLFVLGDTAGATRSLAALIPAGMFTLQGSITTGAATVGTHSGVIDGALNLAALADFNGNKNVDGADLATWRTGFGSLAGTFASGNLDNDGDTDGADFLLWQRQLGSQVPATAASVVIPEPASIVLVAGASCLGGYCRTRRSAARRASMSPAR